EDGGLPPHGLPPPPSISRLPLAPRSSHPPSSSSIPRQRSRNHPLAASGPQVHPSDVIPFPVRTALVLVAALAALAAPRAMRGQPSSADRLPFALGEALEYSVHVTVGGTVGSGQMRVEG